VLLVERLGASVSVVERSVPLEIPRNEFWAGCHRMKSLVGSLPLQLNSASTQHVAMPDFHEKPLLVLALMKPRSTKAPKAREVVAVPTPTRAAASRTLRNSEPLLAPL